MDRAIPGLLMFTLGALAACGPARMAEMPLPEPAAAPEPVVQAAPVRDIHSFARPKEARVTNVDLDLRAHFAAKRLGGTAALDLEVAPGATEIVLDTKDLEIQAVTDAAGRPL